jgi:hypothetical protein
MPGPVVPGPTGAAQQPVTICVGDQLLLPRHGQGQNGFGWVEHRCLLDWTDAPIVGGWRQLNIGSDCVSSRPLECLAGLDQR